MPGRFTLPFLPAGRPRIAVPYDGIKYFGFFSLFFSDFLGVAKTFEKTDLAKCTFFALFCDFGFWMWPFFFWASGFDDFTFSYDNHVVVSFCDNTSTTTSFYKTLSVIRTNDPECA